MTGRRLARRGALLVGIALLVPAVGRAQAAAKPAGGHHGESHGESHGAIAWKELDQYHTLMAASWHPAKDKNDLAPARAKAGELAAAGKALAAAAKPKGCESAEYATKVTALATASTAYAAKAVPATSDAELKAELKALHDRFHGVEEGCQPGEAKKKHGSH